MKFKLLFAFGVLFLMSAALQAQQIPGAPPGWYATAIQDMGSVKQVAAIRGKSVTGTSNYVYSTTTFTFTDLVVFSYFNGTQFYLINSTGAVIDSVLLNENEYYTFSPGMGDYRIEGNNSFTLLIGDPITNSVMGYYAVDESGRPLSTRLNTYMPPYSWGGEHFIVFGYSDNTAFTIRNLTTGTTIAAGILNAGEHYQLDNYLDTFIGVFADKPVSALSYADNGYFNPATNGTFFGTHFYGFSGYVGYWPNGIVITAYTDNTEYLVLNTVTGDTIASGTLNAGEATTDYSTADTYWEVTTNYGVTVGTLPYAYYSSGYYYLTRQMDESGRGIGTNFYAPVIAGQLNIFSFEDGNEITVTNMSSASVEWNDTLNTGESVELYNSKAVYHITGTRNLAVISSNGGSFGADFMPLDYAEVLPDLAVSGNDIVFDPDTVNNNPGDPLMIYATIHNYGFADANSVPLKFFDGHPNGGLPITPMLYISSIPAGGSVTVNYPWTVPSNPSYHAVYVQVDPYNTIFESNSSNNLAYRFLIANDDLLPPLSTSIDAPSGIDVNGDVPEYTNFDITANVFNTGSVDAINAHIALYLPAGLSLPSPADTSFDFGTISAGNGASHTWNVTIDNVTGIDAFFYSVRVVADNAPEKIIERMILLNRGLSVDENNPAALPGKLQLLPNYPNPFNPSTKIRYELPENGTVSITVFDVTGKKVAELYKGNQKAGHHEITFYANELGSGVYFVKLTTAKSQTLRKIMLVR